MSLPVGIRDADVDGRASVPRLLAHMAHETPGDRGFALCLPLSVPGGPRVRADGKRS